MSTSTLAAKTPVASHGAPRRARNKTVAASLALVGGFMGLHRFYLKGLGDWLGWLHPIPTALGLWGIERVRTLGQDDPLSWLLIPLLGFNLAAVGLVAVIYALTPPERWNEQHNPGHPADAPQGRTNWLTILVLVASMLGGTIAFMGSLAYSIQHYFEYQIEEARKLSQ